MAIEGTDIAILSSRVGVARLGASRLGFYPDDVEGTGTSEPGEYVWKETFPPETQWYLQTEGPTCGRRPVANFVFSGEALPDDTSTVTGTVMTNLNPEIGVDVTMTVDGVPWPGGAATTDGAGVYTFLAVPAGAIDVACAANGGTNSGVTAPPATLTLDITVVF